MAMTKPAEVLKPRGHPRKPKVEAAEVTANI